MWWFVASNICFDCLQHVLSLSRYAGPISRARVVSSPFSGLSRVHRTSKSRLAQGGKRRGTEEVQRARTGRTDRRFANDERNDSVARNGESTRLGEKAAERKDLFLRAYAYVTAKAVTYKATARAKTGGSALGVVLFPLLASFTIHQTLLTWRTPETGRAPMSHDFHITVQEIPDACDLSLCVTVVRRSPDAVRCGDSRW